MCWSLFSRPAEVGSKRFVVEYWLRPCPVSFWRHLLGQQTDIEILKRLLTGQLPVADAERFAARYADDSRLAELAEAIADPDDTLFTLLRNQQAMSDLVSESLINRLRLKLRDASSQETSDLVSVQLGLETAPNMRANSLYLEHFRIDRVLGEGGMGTVYLADDERLGRQVALKTLKRELATNTVAKDRFLREARRCCQFGPRPYHSDLLRWQKRMGSLF